MTGDPHTDGPAAESPDGDWRAAEHALGLGDAAARAEAGRRLKGDPAFAAEVASWEGRLAPLVHGVEAVEPPPHLWPRIAAALRPGPARPAAADPRPGLWHSLAFWRWLSAGSLGLAAASLAALAVGLTRPAPPRPEPLVATLAPEDGRPTLTALVDRDQRSVTVLPASLHGPDARVPELWLIPPGGEPLSLGVIQAGRATRIVLPPGLAPHARPEAGLAVSLEPAGGSPTGRPTGPVVAKGALSEL